MKKQTKTETVETETVEKEVEKEAIKVNPWALKRPTSRTLKRTYTDPNQPGVELTIGFRSLDQAELLLALEQSEIATEKYLPSDGSQGALFPPVNNQRVTMSRTLLGNAALLSTMQQPKLYTIEDWVAISVTMPTAFNAILRDVQELNNPKTTTANTATTNEEEGLSKKG